MKNEGFKIMEFKSLEISEEEIVAVQRYISNAHISMNAIMDLEPEVLSRLTEKAWVIDLSFDGIKRNIDYLTKLYSAMYKYAKQNGSCNRRVYRGTTIDEITRLKSDKNSNRFLSTSINKDVAMRFTEYERGALISLYVADDVPYIRADEFLDENQASESEIIVAPYTQITNIRDDGLPYSCYVSEYIANVSKTEFINMSEEEKQRYESIIASYDIKHELERYKELWDKLEINSYRRELLRTPTNDDEYEELLYLRDTRDKIHSQLRECDAIFSNLKTAITAILQDRFRAVEIDIDKNLENEKIVIAEEKRKKEVELFRKNKSELLSQADDTLSQIESVKTEYLTPDSEFQELKLKAESMGIVVYEDRVTSEILKQFEELKVKIEGIKEEISKIDIPDELSMQEMSVSGSLNTKINELYSKLDIVGRVMDECSKAIASEKTTEKEKISKDITMQLRKNITSKVEADFLKEAEKLEQKKDSLWDKITGKAKIKSAQVQNLKLRAEYVRNGGLMLPENLEGIKDYISKYAIVVGKDSLPKEAFFILEEQQTSEEITDEEKSKFEIIKPQSMLVPVKKSKKEILSNLQTQNSDLDKKIQILYSDNANKNKSALGEELKVKEQGRVSSCLYTAICYASNLTEEERKRIINDQITLD